MEDNRMPESVPYIAYEGALARNERTIKRLIIGLIFTVFVMFLSNGIWLYAWMQYDYSSDTVSTTQDGQGININSVGGGNIGYVPEDSSQEEKTDTKE